MLAALTGLVTGFVVAAFDWIVVDVLLDHLFELSPWVLAWMPLLGLVLSWLALRYGAGSRDSGSADLYLKAFHDPDQPLVLRELPGRAVAAIATPGLGGAMGLEGGSLYLGAWFGSFLQRRFPRFTAGSTRQVLMVAGAAAGVAAIFKAPATGALFALEVPYKDDFARRMLLPALVASAVGYLAFVFVQGTTPLFAAQGAAPVLSFADLAGAVALGVAAGLVARAFAKLLVAAKWLAARSGPWLRIVGAGLVMAGLFGITWALTSRPLAIGVGYQTITWALSPDRGLWLLVAVLVIRCIATATTVAGSGVGGLFVPLVVAGALLGRIAVEIVGDAEHHPVRRRRRGRRPRRRLPGSARGRDVRRRSHRSPRLHRPRTPRRGCSHAGDGPSVGHHVPTKLAAREQHRASRERPPPRVTFAQARGSDSASRSTRRRWWGVKPPTPAICPYGSIDECTRTLESRFSQHVAGYESRTKTASHCVRNGTRTRETRDRECHDMSRFVHRHGRAREGHPSARPCRPSTTRCDSSSAGTHGSRSTRPGVPASMRMIDSGWSGSSNGTSTRCGHREPDSAFLAVVARRHSRVRLAARNRDRQSLGAARPRFGRSDTRR